MSRRYRLHTNGQSRFRTLYGAEMSRYRTVDMVPFDKQTDRSITCPDPTNLLEGTRSGGAAVGVACSWHDSERDVSLDHWRDRCGRRQRRALGPAQCAYRHR